VSLLQRVLLATLVVQLLALGAVRFLAARAGGSVGARLLPELALERASRLEVRGRDGDSLVVEKGPDGWGLAAFGGYPADTAKVNGLLRKLAALQAGAPVVTSDRYHAALSVSEGESERRIRVWQEGADPVVDLHLGSSPNATRTYARRAGDDRVYEVDGLPSYEVGAGAAAWIVGRFFEFPAEQVQAFALRNAAGALRVERRGEEWAVTDPPALAGRRLDPGKIEGFLRATALLYAAEPLGPVPDSAFTVASLRVELPGPGGGAPEVRELLVGDVVPGEGQQRAVTRLGFGFGAAVHETGLHRVLHEEWPDFLP
jgi:hypothetical protein